MINVDNQYIDKAIESLTNLLGIKEDFGCRSLFKVYHSDKIKEYIKEISNHLGLNISINLFYVPANYSSANTGAQQFSSQDLVKTDSNQRGVEGITAQVIIPSYLPMFGTSEMNNFPIDVKISDNVKKHPVTFTAIMAHEFSHVLLHSLRFEEKNNEVYTDLTAMVLGFNKIMSDGRVVKEEEQRFNSKIVRTTKYGYLRDAQSNFAYRKIDKILSKYIQIKNKLISKNDILMNRLLKIKKKIDKIEKYIKILDKCPNKKKKYINPKKIVAMHQIDYLDNIYKSISPDENILIKNKNILSSLKHYNSSCFSAVEKEIKLLEERNSIDLAYKYVEDNIKILKKNISIFKRLKLL